MVNVIKKYDEVDFEITGDSMKLNLEKMFHLDYKNL